MAQRMDSQTRIYVCLIYQSIKLGVEGDLNGFDATDSEFLQFVQSLVPLTGENLDHWTWEERRDFLNWCLDEQVLTIQDGRLVPVEETMTAHRTSAQIEMHPGVKRSRRCTTVNAPGGDHR